MSNDRWQWGARAGMIAGALLATACCWLPLSLAVLGLTVVGLGVTLEAWRPLFLVLTFGLMAWAFREAFLRRPAHAGCTAEGSDPGCDLPDGACATRRRGARWFFVGHALLVAAVLALPMLPVGAGVATAASGEETLEAAEAQGHVALTLQVEGMTCMGCVNGVTRLLRDQAGVHAVRVTLEPGQAELQIDPEVTSAEALIAVLAGAGYTAREE